MTDLVNAENLRKKTDTLYYQLAEELAQAIQAGLLRSGEKLPSIRKLSSERQLSLSTIMEAYRELEDRGLVEARPQSGFYVRAIRSLASPELTKPPQRPSHVVIDPLLTPSALSHINDVKVDFGLAILSPKLFPNQQIQRILSQITRNDPDIIANYGESHGDIELRRQIARRSLTWGGQVEADDVLITHGAIEGLNLCLRAVTKPGDVVAIESPAYFGLLQILESFKLKALELPTHPKTGISIEALELASRNGDIKACVLLPNYSNPCGSLMPDENKRRLVQLLDQRNIPLIEDDIYGEFYYQGDRPRPAKAYDQTGNVMLIASFTKLLAPAFRIGWVLGGRWQKEIEQLKFINTFSTSLVLQRTIAHFLESGGYDHHLRRLRKNCAEQVNDAIDAIQRFFPADTRLTVPQGGYVLWVELNSQIETLQLLQLALAEGISFTPGVMFSPSKSYHNCLRVCCGEPWTVRHERAIERLGQLAQQLLQQAQSTAEHPAKVI
ncbi:MULTISPECIES: aminotransferase-like domain-containing protein [Deefgea]|uniref:Putative 8-amino-7-oxononanoate synthase n=1 Tax=Deefgea chitinilytica TaxID=570276 RepID=A0ABS2CBG2_9NEIS|nr:MULTISPECIES: PLP-dependent aminotransferase family protein [Deefgea]MBM5570788.1 aminotransferase class I/II-fold pyridoxal phosphate-dependent enzyme [Deefgea chitinilytica]MBM9888017.1 PLP-dependent aminotransferase family protein [Deefgea sp. CFH1-16]